MIGDPERLLPQAIDMAEKLESGGGAEIDPVLNALGPLGLFSIVQCCLFYSVYLTDAYQALSIVFIGIPVSHRCARPGNNSDVIITEFNHASQNSSVVKYGECSISIHTNSSGAITVSTYPCLYGMEYDRPKDASVMSEFDLVCEHAPLFSILHTAYSLGTGLGSFLFPALSDRYGRKRIMVVCQFLALTWFVAASFTPSYILLLVLKFAAGLCAPGLGLIAVTAGVELFPARYRGYVGGFGSTLLWSGCMMTVAPLAFVLRHKSWRVLQLAFAVAPLVVIPQIIFLSEPLRWLIAAGKIKEFLRVMEKAARWNRKNFPEVLDVFRDLQLEISASHKEAGRQKRDTDKGTLDAAADKRANVSPTASLVRTIPPDPTEQQTPIRQLFSNWHLRKFLFVFIFVSFVDSLIYMSLYLNTASLAGNLYINFFLSTFIEGTSCVLMFFLLERLGRKLTTSVFLFITGTSLTARSITVSFKDSNILHILGTVFAMFARFGIGGSTSCLFLYIPELFPTKIRNFALGLSTAGLTFGGMLAPFTTFLAEVGVWLPCAIYGTCCILAVLMLRLLPETKGRELATTVADIEAWCVAKSPSVHKCKSSEADQEMVAV